LGKGAGWSGAGFVEKGPRGGCFGLTGTAWAGGRGQCCGGGETKKAGPPEGDPTYYVKGSLEERFGLLATERLESECATQRGQQADATVNGDGDGQGRTTGALGKRGLYAAHEQQSSRCSEEVLRRDHTRQ